MPDDPMPERLGRYQIVRVLGKGAMGIVYEGRDPIIGRRVAIKTARRDVMESTGRSEELMERFLREARSAGALNHSNIITIYDADEENGTAYIAMEFIETGTLADLFARKKKLSPKEIVAVGAAMCNALAAAHDKGIVHRDVKPANIMMMPDGSIKVADFGIAHVSDSDLTQEGAMIGTPHFMSPEQFMGQKVDGRSDLFSVGIILYELLTGEKPFTGEILSTVMHKVIKTDPIAPRELNFAVSDCLSKVIMKSLGKSPDDRYQDGRAMAAALLESVKPSPNPAITGVAPSAESQNATVMGRSAAATDATAIASRVPDGAAPISPSPTSAGTPKLAAPQSPEPQTAVDKRPLPVAAIAGGVAVVGLLAAVFLLRSSSEKPAAPANEPAASTQPAESPVFSHINLSVYLANSLEDWDKAKEAIQSGQEVLPFADPQGTANIKVFDGKDGKELVSKEKVDTAGFDLSSPVTEIRIVAAQPGYLDTEVSSNAKDYFDNHPKDEPASFDLVLQPAQ